MVRSYGLKKFLFLLAYMLYFFGMMMHCKLFQVVRWGRSVYANIQKFIQFQLTVNVAALVINVVAAFSTGDVPLNAVQVSPVLFILACICAIVEDLK